MNKKIHTNTMFCLLNIRYYNVNFKMHFIYLLNDEFKQKTTLFEHIILAKDLSSSKVYIS